MPVCTVIGMPSADCGLVERVDGAVVGTEPLRGRVQLQPAQTRAREPRFELGDRGVTLQRIDRGEPDERVGMVDARTRRRSRS